MGNPKSMAPLPPLPPLPNPVGGDAFSHHHQSGNRLIEDDALALQGDDDLPPLYEDVSSSAALLPSTAPIVSMTDASISYFKKDGNTGAESYLSSHLDSEPEVLEKYIRWWAERPPRPMVNLLGVHRHTFDRDGKRETRDVTDFDISIDLTPYLYSDATRGVSWHELCTVDVFEKRRRGTVFRKKAHRSRQHELGSDQPSLAEWCHRYCASHAGLKCFVFEREVHGFDEEKVRQKLESLVRATNYRGRLNISFPVKDNVVQVYNDCKTNRWRLTSWIYWLCVFSLMVIFTWPYLFFRTKRWEVAKTKWYFSKPRDNGYRQFVSISEDQWYNMWGRAINRAVLERRQGTLDQQDLLAAEVFEPVFGDALMDGAVNFVRAGVSAMNEINRQVGWGYDC